MLASIKNKSTGWVAYLIVGLITVPFALFGINQYFTGQQNITVATVGGKNINQNEYAQLFNLKKRQLQEKLSDTYNQKTDNLLKNQTINLLINAKLLENLATNLNIVTTDNEVKQAIISNKNFFKDGIFSLEVYKNILQVNGYSTSEYESLIKKQKNNIQIKDNLLRSEFFTEFEKKQINDLINQERKVAYIELKNVDFMNKVKVTDNEINNFFNKNKEKFNNPKKIKVDFVELNIEKLAKNIIVKQDELLIFYEEEKQRWATEEKRRASHILLENEAEAKNILAKIKSGGNFSVLAKKYSKDVGSAKIGGDLGFFSKGVMVPEFESKVFTMNEGEVSQLVKSDFGYHIIKLITINPVKIQEFNAVKEKITQEYRENQAQKQIFELSEKMATLAYDGSLEDITEELKLQLQTTDIFTENSKNYDKKFIIASFDNDVVTKNENKVFEITGEKVIALRKNQFFAASPKTLKQAKNTIKQLLLAQKTKTMSENKIKEIINKKSGKWSEAKWITRTNKEIPIDVVNFAFTIVYPTNNNASYDYKTLTNKSIAVRVDKIRINPKENNLDSLLVSYNDETFNNILIQLKQKTEIKIYNNRL